MVTYKILQAVQGFFMYQNIMNTGFLLQFNVHASMNMDYCNLTTFLSTNHTTHIITKMQ